MPRGSWLFSQILFDVIIQDWRNLIVEFLHFLRNYIYCLHDGAEFSKINPSFFVDKASCTRQFESDLSLHSLALLFPIKEGSTSHLGLLSSGEKKETALLGARNRYALRLADHQRSRHIVRSNGLEIIKLLAIHANV